MSNIDQGNETGAPTHSLEEHITLNFQIPTNCFCVQTNDLSDTTEKEVLNENTANNELYHHPLEYIFSRENSKTIQKRTDVQWRQHK